MSLVLALIPLALTETSHALPRHPSVNHPSVNAASFLPDTPRHKNSEIAGRDRFNQEISHLLRALGGDDMQAFFGFLPRVSIVPDEMPNAYAKSSHEVEVTEGLLNFLNSTDELVFVIAHELAHHLLHHSAQVPAFAAATARSSHETLERELAADALALELIARAGFSPQAGRTLLTRLACHMEELIPGGNTARMLSQRASRLSGSPLPKPALMALR